MKLDNVGKPGTDTPPGFAALFCETGSAIEPDGFIHFCRISLSDPSPKWIEFGKPHTLTIIKPGFYSIFFCSQFNMKKIFAGLTLNGKMIIGTEGYAQEIGDAASGSAVISINSESPRCQIGLSAAQDELISNDLRMTSGALIISKFIP